MNTLNKVNEKIGHYRWTICFLLFFATTINYMDRQVLSLLKGVLEVEFDWSESDYSNIVIAFQLVYAVSMLFAGRFIDWLGTKKGYAWSLIVWSVAAILSTVSREEQAGFMGARALLGFGESGNFPAAIKTTAEWFPKKERAFATGIFNSGSNLGAILAPLTVPWLAVNYGWQESFYIIGAIGFSWLIFWFWLYDIPSRMLARGRIKQSEYDYIHSDDVAAGVAATEVVKNDHPVGKEKLPWMKLLGYRQTWAFVAGKFMTDGVWWFFLFWLPAYLKAQFGMEGTTVALPLAVLYSMTTVGSIGGGYFPAVFMKSGRNPYNARMIAMLIIALFPLLVLVAQYAGSFSFWYAVVIIGIGASAHQAWSANLFTTVSDMFPKKAVGSVIGIGGMAGGLGGIIISKSAGLLFDHYKELGHIQTGYTIMFVFCALAYVIAWFIMKSLVPKFKLIEDL